MEVLENIILADLPDKLRKLKIPATAHVRVVIHELKEHPQNNHPQFAETPGCNLWKDRDDLNDPTVFVDKIRLPRYFSL